MLRKLAVREMFKLAIESAALLCRFRKLSSTPLG